MMHQQSDGWLKPLLRLGYRGAMLIHVLATAAAGREGQPRVFYGGARSGNLGGPLVKVKRLQQYFPQEKYNYNLVYAISNAPYLPATALTWLKRRRIPLVLNQNGVFYPGWYGGDWQAQNRLMSMAYHRADYVFWQSEFCRRCAEQFLGAREGPGRVLYNAIDVERFAPVEGHRVQPFTFLVTGKIGRHLGYRLDSTIGGLAIARAAGLDARLMIAGWVEDRVGAEAMAVRHRVSEFVDFHGAYRQEDAPQIYRKADAYVMTKYLDPCPNTVLEAMACGLPVLYSASGGVPELVGENAGIGMSVPEDWSQIHMPTKEVVGEGMLAVAAGVRSMAVAARERALAHFDLRIWIQRHREVFDRLLAMRL